MQTNPTFPGNVIPFTCRDLAGIEHETVSVVWRLFTVSKDVTNITNAAAHPTPKMQKLDKTFPVYSKK